MFNNVFISSPTILPYTRPLRENQRLNNKITSTEGLHYTSQELPSLADCGSSWLIRLERNRSFRGDSFLDASELADFRGGSSA